ncbi:MULTISPECIES: PTS fructose transporter subunit EIIC [Clostridium]|uniref:PTS fructose transporter subunit EIIC n=1 Tax=Clostridium TaxID=1485 RepID=UPI00069FD9A2|nr:MULTISPECIES: PTS fructose transporter subunit EIIC [Clostridium]KOF57614.1 PTS system fructose-like transporter subunit EIIC [Clostridium sp. DMHC 10]MCD2348641.1 PTS fructose transporter subunit EIIC [Clostridium guangxiense]
MSDLKALLKDSRQHLMTGVSYMIPFVVAGGVLLALSVLLYGSAAVPPKGTALNDLFNIGAAGLGLMVPILAGYIAFSMADRPGIAPGAIGGYLASQIGAGFLGGIIAGLLAGIVVYCLKKIKVPSIMRSVMPIFVIPLIGTLIVGGLMVWVIGTPVAEIMTGMKAWLNSLGTGNLVLLGVILGAMIGFDMGGPINKVAYGFGAAMVGTIDKTTGMASPISLKIMAAIGVAICVPPIGLGIATLLAPKKYTTEEKEAGKAGILMGLIGITEGAIPFAAADPIKVIPSIVAGSASGAVTAMLLGAKNPAPWGGWIVLPVATGKIGYVIATIVGVAVTAVLVNVLKKPITEKSNNSDDNHDSDEIELDFE